MKETLSDRRMAENQVVFRGHNESVQKSFDELDKIARQEGQEAYLKRSDMVLHFYCECSDENCRKRVVLLHSKYRKIHQKKTRFIITCGHEVPKIESIVVKEPDYCVVEKFFKPPDSSKVLNKTKVKNT